MKNSLKKTGSVAAVLLSLSGATGLATISQVALTPSASAATLAPSMFSDFTYNGTNYAWNINGNSLTITSAVLNQPNGTNAVTNDTEGIIAPPRSEL